MNTVRDNDSGRRRPSNQMKHRANRSKPDGFGYNDLVTALYGSVSRRSGRGKAQSFMSSLATQPGAEQKEEPADMGKTTEMDYKAAIVHLLEGASGGQLKKLYIFALRFLT